jgi:hypothetical protein
MAGMWMMADKIILRRQRQMAHCMAKIGGEVVMMEPPMARSLRSPRGAVADRAA